MLSPFIAAINHLLAQEPWACQQLARHAGKLACVDTGAFALRLAVMPGGLVEPAPHGAIPDVTIRIKLSDLPHMAHNREHAFSYVKIDGDADFANTISQVGKTVRWDAEHDLEKVFGPIAAVRLVSGARAAFGAALVGQQKLAENVAEYFLDEQPLLVRPVCVEQFSSDVARLRDDVERTAKRIDKLVNKLALAAPAPSGAASPSQDH